MSKKVITLQVEFDEDKSPEFYANMDVLGGKLSAVSFTDNFDISLIDDMAKLSKGVMHEYVPILYLVSREERIYGADSSHSFDGYILLCKDDDELYFETLKELDEFLDSEENKEDSNYTEEDFQAIYYHKYLEPITVFLSYQAALDFTKGKKGLFIDSLKINAEIKLIHDFLRQFEERK